MYPLTFGSQSAAAVVSILPIDTHLIRSLITGNITHCCHLWYIQYYVHLEYSVCYALLFVANHTRVIAMEKCINRSSVKSEKQLELVEYMP